MDKLRSVLFTVGMMIAMPAAITGYFILAWFIVWYRKDGIV